MKNEELPDGNSDPSSFLLHNSSLDEDSSLDDGAPLYLKILQNVYARSGPTDDGKLNFTFDLLAQARETLNRFDELFVRLKGLSGAGSPVLILPKQTGICRQGRQPFPSGTVSQSISILSLLRCCSQLIYGLGKSHFMFIRVWRTLGNGSGHCPPDKLRIYR